jgi:hypothetical protein
MQVKYRSFTPALNPRRTKLEVPGWGGERQPRKDGSMEQAWHCLPFSEAARYGIELFYPYENELRVTTIGGRIALDGKFGSPPGQREVSKAAARARSTRAPLGPTRAVATVSRRRSADDRRPGFR